MTGKSDLSAECRKYYKYLVSGTLMTAGNFLIFEHFIRYGGFDIELFGHEWYGLGMIIAGMVLSLKWGQLRDIKRAIKERSIRKIFDEGERYE